MGRQLIVVADEWAVTLRLPRDASHRTVEEARGRVFAQLQELCRDLARDGVLVMVEAARERDP